MQQRPLFSSTPQPSARKEPDVRHRIYTVSELTAEFKFLLESTYPSVWVEGELSDFKQPLSGHFYFCLKDGNAQIRAVMWRSAHRYMKWRPRDGMKVLVNGRLTLYETRGEYQIEVVQIVPHGKGDLMAAFEQLKEKLQKEGLFDPKRKRPIPTLPKKIGIVTSRTGAVIRDILNILNRRYANVNILICPAKVQGEDAAPTIVEAIRALNRYHDIDVLILARGGGSIEDLWPFNEESVARAIAASRIPIISGVGHETDQTIADFVADLRAPTPSAAAELVIGKKSELLETILHLTRRMEGAVHRQFLSIQHRLQVQSQNRAFSAFPQKIHTYQQTIDDLEMRVRNGLTKHHQIQMHRLLVLRQGLNASQLRHLIELKRSRIIDCLNRIRTRIQAQINTKHRLLSLCMGKLDSLSPLSVLERGYSITMAETGAVLRDASQTAAGERIRVRLHRGNLKCEVKEIEKNE